MTFAIDLISDLHTDTWDQALDWSDQATSAFCLVLGDITSCRENLVKTLEHLSTCYRAVFYIDGNAEHRDYYTDLPQSYRDLYHRLKRIPNVVYLHENVVIIEGVAILATNGWWTYDFDPDSDRTQVIDHWASKTQISTETADTVSMLAISDAGYLERSVKKLQRHYDVGHILIATHTVPLPRLIAHDTILHNTMDFNYMGNSLMSAVVDQDLQKKIHTWCFGHYHGSIDQVHDGIRYVNHCRGKGKTDYGKSVFHPKRIVI